MLGTQVHGGGTKNEKVLAAVRPMALGLSALYCFFAIDELLLGAGPSRKTAVLTTAVAALAMAVLAGVVGRFRPPARSGHRLLFALAGLLFGSMTVAGPTPAGEAGQPGIHFGVLVTGTVLVTGMIMYSRRWVVATAVLGALFALLPPRSYGSADFRILASLAIVTGVAVLAVSRRIGVHNRWRALHREHRQRRDDLEASERRFALAMEGASDGLYDWDHEKNEVYYSPRWKSILGLDEEEIGTAPAGIFDRTHPDDQSRVRELMHLHLKGTNGHFECEFRILHKDGSYRLALVRGASIRDETGRALRTAGSLTDLTGRGVFDSLTGLPNRRLLLDRVNRAIQHSNRGHHDFALLFIDLDRFKLINDTLGHHAGDEVLVEVAARLQTCVRASDTVGRLGGDEFVVILEQIDLPDGAAISIERIIRKLNEPFVLEERDFYIRTSVGVVMETESYTEAEELIRDADTAMYQAKSQGQGWVVFDGAMRLQSSAQLQLESELRAALDYNEFYLEYQPFVSLKDNKIEGYEALVRWDHPGRGRVPASEFIPTMEETGMINRLGRWVLAEACREMQALYPKADEKGRPTLSVNVSRKQLLDTGLTHQIQSVLEATGFDSERLRLEITETAIVERADLAIAILSQVKEMGIEVMMDDFGTGHSSLGALGDLPIDTLKIDQSFIARLTSDKDGLEVVRTIIKMASHLGLKVIAEGIETEEQLRLLKESSCPTGQGYHLARPARLAPAPQTVDLP